VNQLKKIKELEEELAQYKKMYTKVALQNTVLKDVIKKVLRPVEKRELVGYAHEEFRMSIR
jgi:putative transposase